jgi:hypothetical protein
LLAPGQGSRSDPIAAEEQTLTATLAEPTPAAATTASHVRLNAEPADVRALNQMVAQGAQASNEQPAAR